MQKFTIMMIQVNTKILKLKFWPSYSSTLEELVKNEFIKLLLKYRQVYVLALGTTISYVVLFKETSLSISQLMSSGDSCATPYPS